MAEQRWEFFKKEFQFTGIHSRMAGELWVKENIQHSYFKRLIDLYLVAPLIGFRLNRKAKADYSEVEPKSIFPEQMLGAKDKLDFMMQMILMLEYVDTKEAKDCVDRAFREPETKEEFDAQYALFNEYVRGGVEELYERLVVRKADVEEEYKEERSANVMGLLERFGDIE